MKLRNAKNVAFAAVLSILLMVSVAYYWPVQEAYHPLNSDWNGCSIIASIAQNVTLLLSYDRLPAKSTSLLAIIGPSTDFSVDQSSRIANFLEAGGNMLLADDFGTGNRLLRALNVSASFSMKPLADLYYYSRNPDFPLITNFSPSPATVNLTAVLLDHPSYINIGNSRVTAIGSSSPFSFIDSSGEGRPLANESIDSYPVMASTRIGKGMLILVADPNMFINEMSGLYDNLQMFENLLKMSSGSVIFDVAHLGNALLTNGRILLKNEINSLNLEKERMYVTLLVVSVLLMTFSFQLVRLRRIRKAAK